MNKGTHRERAQVTLELALALFCTLFLFWATFKVLYWANANLVERQKAYEDGPSDGRVWASTARTEVQVDESGLQPLDFFTPP